jgi:hypothetical protein
MLALGAGGTDDVPVLERIVAGDALAELAGFGTDGLPEAVDAFGLAAGPPDLELFMGAAGAAMAFPPSFETGDVLDAAEALGLAANPSDPELLMGLLAVCAPGEGVLLALAAGVEGPAPIKVLPTELVVPPDGLICEAAPPAGFGGFTRLFTAGLPASLGPATGLPVGVLDFIAEVVGAPAVVPGGLATGVTPTDPMGFVPGILVPALFGLGTGALGGPAALEALLTEEAPGKTTFVPDVLLSVMDILGPVDFGMPTCALFPSIRLVVLVVLFTGFTRCEDEDDVFDMGTALVGTSGAVVLLKVDDLAVSPSRGAKLFAEVSALNVDDTAFTEGL